MGITITRRGATVPDEDQSAETDTSTADAAAGSATDDAADLKAENVRLKALARKHEDRAKENFAWRRENEKKVQEYDGLVQASKTEQERAVEQARKDAAEAARKDAATEALGKFGPRLVGAEFRTHLAGRMAPEQIAELVDGLNISKFLNEDGEPDADAVKKYVAAIPATTAPPEPVAPARPVRDIGGGSRPAPKVDGLSQGEDLYARRHKKKSPA